MPFVRQARAINRDDNASHAVLELDVDIQMFQARFRTLWRPMPFDAKALEGKKARDQQDMMGAEVWGGGQQEAYEFAIEIGDVEGAMAMWNHTAENFLGRMVEQGKGEDQQDAREAGGRGGVKSCRGRRKEVRMVRKALTATSQRRMPEIGATTASMTRMAKAQRRLKDLQAKLRYLDKTGWSGGQALGIYDQANILCDKVDRYVGYEIRERDRGVTGVRHRMKRTRWAHRHTRAT